MKVLGIILLAAFLSLSLKAAPVECISENKVWKVEMDLDSGLASTINFYKNDLLFKSYSNVEVLATRISFPEKVMAYEMKLGGIKYLHVSRKLKGKIPTNLGTAEFLLNNNPVGFAKHVDCQFL